MSTLFGLHPWDVDRLTLPQWREYRAYIDARIGGQGVDDNA